MLTTYFQAELQCGSCRESGTAWIPSRLGDAGATYHVGDCHGDDILAVDFEDTSFVVRTPKPGEAIHVLMWWTCEHCGVANFAEVVFDSDCVVSIERIELDSDTLRRIHYVNELLSEVIEAIIDGSIYDEAGVRPDWLSRFEAGLAAGRRWS